MAKVKPKEAACEHPSITRYKEIFRAEHREIRDALLSLVAAFEKRNKRRIKSLLKTVAELSGPHFRYEEDALYPALIQIYGKLYIEHMLVEHDKAIVSALRLEQIAEKKKPLDDTDVKKAVHLVRGILPHVSDCEGLSIMVEVLPEGVSEDILKARDRARNDNFDLLTWANEVRERPFMLTYQREVYAALHEVPLS
jgi:hemerythrin-like domain-containing protein